MSYEVIVSFRDVQDKNKEYKVGDTYPNPANKKISRERLNELLSSDNKTGKPLIKEKAKEQEE